MKKIDWSPAKLIVSEDYAEFCGDVVVRSPEIHGESEWADTSDADQELLFRVQHAIHATRKLTGDDLQLLFLASDPELEGLVDLLELSKVIRKLIGETLASSILKEDEDIT